MPILVILEAGGGSSDDYMAATSYMYDASAGSYTQRDFYAVGMYSDRDKILDTEKETVLKRLKAVVDYAAPHTVTVQGVK